MLGLSDWNGFVPDQAEHRHVDPPTRRSLRITPVDGEAYVISLVWDDGNGMWISPGVSL